MPRAAASPAVPIIATAKESRLSGIFFIALDLAFTNLDQPPGIRSLSPAA